MGDGCGWIWKFLNMCSRTGLESINISKALISFEQLREAVETSGISLNFLLFVFEVELKYTIKIVHQEM